MNLVTCDDVVRRASRVLVAVIVQERVRVCTWRRLAQTHSTLGTGARECEIASTYRNHQKLACVC
jgi:hypothetical protein